MDRREALADRAEALRPAVQAAFGAGGLDAVCEPIAAITAPLEACGASPEKRLNMRTANSVVAVAPKEWLLPAAQQAEPIPQGSRDRFTDGRIPTTENTEVLVGNPQIWQEGICVLCGNSFDETANVSYLF